MAENAARTEGYRIIAGVDEAGRGPWAGPVVAAAVILPEGRAIRGLADSKQLLPEEREDIAAEIVARARVGVGVCCVATIDRINILQATFAAMTQAIAKLGCRPCLALIDGHICPTLPCAARPVIGGDAAVAAIAAASIVAKVTRDRLMVRLAGDYPAFGWERNKGYGTPQHAHGLARFGPTLHHRASFAPIRALLRPTAAFTSESAAELR